MTLRKRQRLAMVCSWRSHGLSVPAKDCSRRYRFCCNDYITEYGGEVIDKAEAERRRAAGHATHIRGLSFGHTAIDGRHVIGVTGDGGASFANDPFTVDAVARDQIV